MCYKRLCSCLLLIVFVITLSACKDDTDVNTDKFPISKFEAYSTIIDTGATTHVLRLSDSRNFRLWIDSCLVQDTTNIDIRNNWTYRLVFCSDENILDYEGMLYIPYSAVTHTVYINEELDIIQFDDFAYQIQKTDDNSMSFYDGIREYIEASETVE